MSRRRYDFLTWVARNWRWGWVHLVSPQERRLWVHISSAMIAHTIHPGDWVQGPDDLPIPAWVPCHLCGGGPCRVNPAAGRLP